MPSSVWKGYLSFGLVSFPIRLTAAARPEAVHFHLLHKKDLSRIKEVRYCEEENKPLQRGDLVKGYEYAKGEYVVVEEEELKKIAPPSAKIMEIVQFVAAGEVDPVFLEKSYYVMPEEAVSKPYALLLKAMTETQYYAIAKITMHAREHIVVIRPTKDGIVLHTMYYPEELHQSNQKKVSAKEKFGEKEMSLAKRLIETLAAPFKPEEFHDTYRENVEKLIEQKRHGRKVTAVKQPRTAPVVDILQALQRSLKQKPQGTARKRPKPARRRSAA